MLVVHKTTAPTQHGRASTPEEDEAATWISEALMKAAAATPVTLADAAAKNAAEVITERFTTNLRAQEGWQKFTALMQAKAELGAMRTATVRKATAVDPGNFTLVNPAVTSWADEHAAELVSNIGDTTKSSINALVNGAVGGKMTVTQLTTGIASALPLTGQQTAAMNNAVAAYYEKHSGMPGAAEKAGKLSISLGNSYTKTRAKMIARTELSNAQNAGHYISMSQQIENGTLEPGTVKEWSTAEDEKTCPICRPYDGQIVAWDKPFGNGLLTPPAHPNCRCTFNDLPPDVLDDPTFERLPSEEELYGNTVIPQKPSPGWKGPDLLAEKKPLADFGNDFGETLSPAAAPATPASWSGVQEGQLLTNGDGSPYKVVGFSKSGNPIVSNGVSTKVIYPDDAADWGLGKIKSPVAAAPGPQSAGGIKVGQTVWDADNGSPLMVTGITDKGKLILTDMETGKPLATKLSPSSELITTIKPGEKVPITPYHTPKPPSATEIDVGNLSQVPGPRASDSTWIRWMNTNWPSPAWTPAQEKAIQYYTGSWAGEVNGQLRRAGGDLEKVSAKARAKALDAAINASPAPTQLVVVRGTGSSGLRKLIPGIGRGDELTADQVKSLIGQEVSDEGYLSTSVGNIVFDKVVQWNITVPKGTPAAWVTKLSQYGEAEKEVLLGRETKMLITGARKANGKLIIDAEVTG
jgi:SPP1 gp7 family putative phage head morphogenesis protein